jgi:hypothetical protein
MWECDFDKLKNSDFQPLRARDALFVGRTNAIKFFYNCKEDEKIKYQDYTSLYPDIEKHGVFPVGHPKVITQDFQAIERYFGLIKCTVLPPSSLFFPVLPARINNKLVFTLFYKCAQNHQQHQSCQHADTERSFMGTWCTLEVNEAIKHNYKIVHIESRVLKI